MSAPSAGQRRACWGARDEFWHCLDENQGNAGSCQQLRKQFESNCPAQWVKYFDRRRDYIKYKEKMEAEGFEPLKEPQKS
ncbi:cytochrome c oxidase assembly factor 6 homolog [Erpetoichthys calabaricus]|uniref:Cytochrome c oxidase assembly factor 6 n=1 Tax=Erpetoichthys calabaricus TaxID=27687 RepID=A0A8C4S534_ERPCA|nr:cytochrome c oxidase assembly factor 6 homolog [Erpetoichthys calabaricus]